MSLRPQKAGRSRRWKRASLNSRKKWVSDWDWQDVTNAWHGFNPAKHKRGLSTVLIIFLSLVIYSWAQQPTNGLFHSYIPDPNCKIQNVGNPCTDPTTYLWQRMNGQPASLADFNLSPNQRQTYSSNCDSLGNGQDCISLDARSGNNSVAISANPINDLSLALSKTLGIVGAFKIDTLGFSTGGRGNSANTWGIFITTNNTAPAHDIGSSSKYSPFDDPSVVYAEEIYCVGGTCGGTGVSGTYNVLVYVARHIGTASDTLQNQDTGACGGSSGSCIMAISAVSSITQCFQIACNGGNVINANAVYLNYTGSATTNNVCSINANVLLGAGCSWVCATYAANNVLTFNSNCAGTPIIPSNPFGSGHFYLGVWSNVANFAFEYEFAPGTTPALGGTIGMEATAFVPNPAGTLTSQPNIDVGGFFGPIVKALISIGVFMLNALLAFVSFIAPALQTALNFMETLVTNILNLIGNALGFGNLGTDLANFLNALINFFTQQLPGYIGDFPSYFTNFISLLAIEFPFLTPLFTIANAIIQFGTNGVAQGITILTIGLQMFLFGFGTLMWVGFIIYTGDDAIGGFWAYLGTLEYLSFKILNLIATVTNLGIDFIVHIISLIPKPFIQMNAGRLPRLPVVEASASMTFPKLDFGEARNGNLLVYWLWSMGVWFGIWFESRNPSLPGSIGALDPAVAANVRILASFLPLMQAVTLISGGLVVIWFSMLPLRLAGIDVTESPLGAGLGRIAGPGPGGISVKAGTKHLRKTVRKRLAERGEANKKEKEKAEKAIEKTKKEIEAEKRAEALRKRELERKPTGKDLRGPNLQ